MIEIFWDNVETIRKQKNLTKTQVMCDLSMSMYYGNVTIKTIEKIANNLEVPADYLLLKKRNETFYRACEKLSQLLGVTQTQVENLPQILKMIDELNRLTKGE